MKYREALKKAMEMLAENDRIRFIGYNVKYGSRAYGTLNGVQLEKLIETPVAENLMAGLAIGLSLEGFIPLVWFERHDFILNALDALVNHADKINEISHGEFNVPLIIRAAVGATKPLYPGLQHTQNLTNVLERLMKYSEVIELKTPTQILKNYTQIRTSLKKLKRPILFIEYRDLYENEE